MKRRPSGECTKCQSWRYSLHRDHIIPKFKGGSDTPDNWQYICANCHEDKTREERKGHRQVIPLDSNRRGPDTTPRKVGRRSLMGNARHAATLRGRKLSLAHSKRSLKEGNDSGNRYVTNEDTFYGVYEPNDRL